MKNSNTQTLTARLFLLTSIFLFPAMQAWSETRYVSDQLSIPMRSGASSKHRIVSFPKSGMLLNIQETSEDGVYLRVITPDGKEGWVEKQYSMRQPSARDRIVVANKKLEKSIAQVKDLEQQISTLETQNKELSAELKQNQREIKSQESSMEKLRRVSANPVALAKNNRMLENQLSQLTASNTLLAEENIRLADESTKDWFMLGAAVSLGSLLFGLLITRINWKRKRQSWGDF